MAATRSDELFALAVVALALGTGLVSHHFGLSVALGAFLAGLMVGETEFNHRSVAQVIPFRDVFASLFFVSVGMMIDPRFVVSHIVPLAALCAMGAREAVEPEFEGSLELLRHTFQAYGIADATGRAELDEMRERMQCSIGGIGSHAT